MKRLLIQGFFFQERSQFGVAYLTGDGPVAMTRKQMLAHLFAGIIQEDAEQSGVLVGDMQDAYGVSRLSSIEISEGRLVFVKRYVERGDPIQYEFRKEDTVWVGTWSGPMVGFGQATCLLAEAPEALFTKSS